MLDALKGIVSSKKWIGVLIMIVIAVLVQEGVLNADMGHTIEVALGIGVAGQAVADHQKSAAQINAASAAAQQAQPPAPPKAS